MRGASINEGGSLLARRVALGIVCSLSALHFGCLDMCSRDHPGYCEDLDEDRVRTWTDMTVRMRTVTDLETGEVLCEGCNACDRVAAVPGQRLLVEDRLQERTTRVVVERLREKTDPSFWCSDDPELRIQPISRVEPLDTYYDVSEVDPDRYYPPAGRVLEMGVIPTAPDATVQDAGTYGNEPRVTGQGHRFVLEVLRAGEVFVERTYLYTNGNTGEEEEGRDVMQILKIECGSATPCRSLEVCNAGECDDRPCESNADCLEDQVCGTYSCIPKADPSVAMSPAYRAHVQLTLDVGCWPLTPENWSYPTECDAAMLAWIACVRTDLSQCHCTENGSLDCWGSVDPAHGPALCTRENSALASCSDG